MKTFRSKTGPFLDQPHFTLKEIEQMCAMELRRTGLLPTEPGPVRIERFVEKRFGVSPSYEDLPDGVLGFTEFGVDGVIAIIVSRIFETVDGSKALERRLRATLAHEAGHGLMHAYLFATGERPASMFDDSSVAPTILCRDIIGADARSKGYDGRWWEYQANRAIGGLLMPRNLVEKAVEKFLESAGLLGLPILPTHNRETAIRTAVDVFDVNSIVARYRLDEVFPSRSSDHPTL
jgi:hypothetical protein